jgi:hypothetical protein
MLVSEVLIVFVSLYYGIFACLVVKSSYDEEWFPFCHTAKQQLHRMKRASVDREETVPV